MDDKQRELARNVAQAARIRARRRMAFEVRWLRWALDELNQRCDRLTQIVATWELANGVEKIANESGEDGGEKGL